MITCAECLELLPAHALGALEPEERARVEEHLASGIAHEGCVEKLSAMTRAAHLLAAGLVPVRPGPATWAGIEKELGLAEFARPQARAASVREPLAWLTAAAATIALLLSHGARQRQATALATATAAAEAAKGEAQRGREERTACLRDLETMRDELGARREALALLEHPATQVVALAPYEGSALHARALVNLALHKALVLAPPLAVAPTGKDYELWVIRGKDKIAAGVLRQGPHGDMVAAIDPRLLEPGRPDALAVTVEPTGGLPHPTGPIVMLGLMPKT